MAGGPDQLHAAREGLLIGFRPDESGKKRMVDIDHAQQVLGDELRSQDLHVTREHDQVHVLPEQLEHLPFGLALVFGVGQEMEGDLIELGQRLGGRVIADDPDDVAASSPMFCRYKRSARQWS